MPAAFDFAGWGRIALDALFPLECLACGTAGAHACGACLLAVPPAPFEPSDPRPLASAAGGFAYASPLVRALIGDFKYRGYRAARPAIETLARRAAASCAGRFVAPQAVVPVPLHGRRLRTRGFNQADAIAEAVAASWGLPLLRRAVVRRLDTFPQAELGARRRLDLRGAFFADARAVRGLRLVLVDDVWTSGATMRACADALLAAGAAEVRGFALAWGSGKKEPEVPSHPAPFLRRMYQGVFARSRFALRAARDKPSETPE